MSYQFDKVDAQILLLRSNARRLIDEVLVGDYILFPSGEMERVSNILAAGVQTSPVNFGSFYLGDSGRASFSGSLNPPVPLSSISTTEETIEGEYWFFHHGKVGAHRAVYFKMGSRVFKTSANYKGFLHGTNR